MTSARSLADGERPREEAPHDALARDLAAILGAGAVSNALEDRVAYSRDLWPRHTIGVRAGVVAPAKPRVVVWPSHRQHVVRVIDYARARQIPLVPFGAGSGVCGAVEPTSETIVVDMKRMRAITRVDADAAVVRAEAGILGQHLEDALHARGLTLGHFPSSIYCSTLGGWLAARSAGQCSGRYGKIEDMVLAASFVDGNSNVFECLRGGSEGWRLPLVIGSEGTLGIVTDATLRVWPAPGVRTFASYTLDDVHTGLEVIREIYQAGLRPAVARLYDPFDTFLARRNRATHDDTHARRRPDDAAHTPGLASTLLRAALRSPRALNALVDAVPTQLFGGAMLVLVWETEPELAACEQAIAARIADRHGARDGGEGPARRWLEHRHAVSYRMSPTFAAGAFVDTLEVAAPWSRLEPMYEAVRRALAPHVFVMAHFSHAYPDGASIYFTFAGAAADDVAALAVYDTAYRAGLEAALSAGGTLSHHHGVGRSKAPLMRREHGDDLEAVLAIKRAWDPAGIFNPGALFGPPQEQREASAATAATAPGPKQGSDRIDELSRTIRAQGSERLVDVEKDLAAAGLTLAVDPRVLASSGTVAEWLASGAPGARATELDPVDQLVSGGVVALTSGPVVHAKPAPRRAVGPDVLGAVLASRGELGAFREVELVAVRRNATRRVVHVRVAREGDVEALIGGLRATGIRATRLERGNRALSITLEGPMTEAWAKHTARLAAELGGSTSDAPPRSGAAE